MPTILQRGYTVTGLLVGLAAAGIALSIGVPSVAGFIANQAQVSATNELVNALDLARDEALRRSRYVTVCRSTNGEQCNASGNDWKAGWIVFANDSMANINSADANDEILRYFDRRGDKRRVLADRPNLTFVAFTPTGTVAAPVTWTFCDSRGDDEARAITLNRAGRARASLPQAPNPPPGDYDGEVPGENGAICS
ncbi:MAG: hypothetical protein HKN49_03980 [Gammaproteobacteria bacterium]|nr:hypothetical protein [Gammaproteobacteria bacterium]